MKIKIFFDKILELNFFVIRNSSRVVKSFLFDGVRFSYKVYAYTHAILNASNDIDGLICIDADSVFYQPINVDWLQKNIHRDNHMLTHLGRKFQYSECGFLYFNLRHPETKNYALEMKMMYDENKI
jgi:hypothetical protein